MPKTVVDLNGIEWPQACFADEEEGYHFFVIGDWGGVLKGGVPVPFVDSPPRMLVPQIDSKAQQLVAFRMSEVARTSRPRFVINVGDNFYPGGILGHCSVESGVAAFGSMQFAQGFEQVYHGDGLDFKEWWGVLGNHDWGGWKYTSAWDQNIFYTWHAADSRWLTPALFWSRRVQFRDFVADFFFVDTNIFDTMDPEVDSEHNICSSLHNLVAEGTSCGAVGPQDPASCPQFFRDLFEEKQRPWLEEGLAKSTAEWQIIVTHFPPAWGGHITEVLRQVSTKYGVDLILSGHTHHQEVYYKEAIFGDTAWIVSGGGGGITSEETPTLDGQDDQYGFMDLTISKDTIKVEAHSHGGVNGSRVIRSTTVIKPRLRPGDAVVVDAPSAMRSAPEASTGSQDGRAPTEKIEPHGDTANWPFLGGHPHKGSPATRGHPLHMM
jgi:UDP-2,3-diacylglucosamine pyrophosphatase LpxH